MHNIQGGEQIKIYNADFEWETPWGKTTGYFRKGHYHWGDEGDFFGFYPEAYYGPNIDIYNVDVPVGIESEGKRMFEGLKVAAGPQVFWGANPLVMAKYFRRFGKLDFALLHREDISQITSGRADSRGGRAPNATDVAQSVFKLGWRRCGMGHAVVGFRQAGLGLHFGTTHRRARLRGLRLPHPRRPNLLVRYLGVETSPGAQEGPVQVHAQGGYQGLVADAGADQRINVTGWQLKPSGRGNQYHVTAGGAWRFGFFELAPQVLYQKPLEGPLPTINGLYSSATGVFYPDISPRDRLNSPFLVLENRETLAGELLFSFDPTPGSWMWQWDNELREDADFAGHLRAIYRHQPTSRDARIGFNAEGGLIRFLAAPPAQDVWDLGIGMTTNSGALRTRSNIYAGQNQSSGMDARLITRYGADLQATLGGFRADAWVKFNDWGPFDYYRDYNLTFPVQGFVSGSFQLPVTELGDPTSRLGISAYGRTFDEYSPKFNENRLVNEEYEIMTFWELSL